MSTISEFLRFYENFIMVYTFIYLLLYIILAVLAFIAIKKYYNSQYFLHKDVLIKSNHGLGVSIVAPAYNEEATIVYNVTSLLSQTYPKFEVIIVNDGSTDKTLDKLIAEFSLVKVDFFYQEKIETAKVRAHYKSTNSLYAKLLVIDKVNGKSKADASNAGINSAKYPLFICTDVDCILRRDTISVLVKPFVESTRRVIAAGAAIRISNSSEFKDGMLHKSFYPRNFFARFQELEYIRSFLFGRMAHSEANCLMLVSGGLGIFDKEIVIAAGGYWSKSLGEDMELILRMRKLMYEGKQDFVIKYIPESLCWTEVPSKLTDFSRQRVRWSRGLIQTLFLHRSVFMNPKYGRTGMVIFPYFVFFEFLVPILELLGICVIITEIFFFDINYHFLLVISVAVYLFYTIITLISIVSDQRILKQYSSVKEITILLIVVFLEPILYHPINVFSSLKGYWNFFWRTEHKWGVMNREGFKLSAKTA